VPETSVQASPVNNYITTMPATADFSFEKDVAPYASRYFDRIAANPALSGSQKTELQGMLLGGVDEIRQQQLKLQEDRQQGRMRDLQYATGVSALEEARAKRARMEMASREVGESQFVVQQIMAGMDTPEEKRRKLAEYKIANAAKLALNPDAKQVFEIADSSLPKSGIGDLTKSQISRFAEKKVPLEILETGDPVLIGQTAAQIAAIDEAKQKLEKGDEEAKQLRLRLAQEPLKFAKDETTGTQSDWLEPESTMRAELIIESFGDSVTKEDRERFAALKTAGSDRERADLIEKIQLREQVKALRGGVEDKRRSLAESMFSPKKNP